MNKTVPKKNFWLEIRCDRCKEEYVDDCVDCAKKQEGMGVKVTVGETDVQIVYRPKGPDVKWSNIQSIIDVKVEE